MLSEESERFAPNGYLAGPSGRPAIPPAAMLDRDFFAPEASYR